MNKPIGAATEIRDGRLTGKRAIITGAGSRGIGRAIAVAFAREGADVAVLWHARQVEARRTLALLQPKSSRSIIMRCDLRHPTGARRAFTAAIERLGGVDILVSNAATLTRTEFLKITDEEWNRVLETNLRGCFIAAQEAGRYMVAHGGGRIIVVSSVNQKIVTRLQAHYCASKGGVMQLARAMALELAPHGVNVNVIAPGLIETDMTRRVLADRRMRRQRIGTIPLGRIGTPEDVAGAALFLASAESSYATGASIFVDGGLVLGG